MQATPSSRHSPIQARDDQGFEAGRARQYLNDIKGPLGDLTAAIDALQGQTMQIALLGNPGTRQEILDLREQMRYQDQKHKEGVVEIQGILDDMLESQIVANMRKQVEQEIADHIESLVQEQVAECLKDHIPQELQDEIAMSKRELDELNLRLHNSESRRANGNLRQNKPDEPLATMFMPDGNVSGNYPKDLKSLFELDAESIKKIMQDYGLPEPTDSRDHNLNRLMQFCGVRYQLVERHPSDPASSM
ncbi:hypothetical protein D9613_000913 [Agrocybe pediades]|uniref:Uncharacterized protein n=1 Tax=Agrocybe pediades TaxID=84607 RepID=A0A8H4VSK9_9AGAR|nr:hypothetical protein D9613_000913 [Agrocybe pediades]KAF9560985.1 hypothetical protein CPC08DRAFT_742672 [Agrocybe pediades]